MKRYGYVLVCEGCMWDIKAYAEYAEPGEKPWSPCGGTEVVASFPQYETAEEAKATGSLVASELYGKEYAKLWWWRVLRALKIVSYGRVPSRRDVLVYEHEFRMEGLEK